MCTAPYKMLLFHVQTTVSSRNVGLALLEEEKHFGHFAAFWFDTFLMLFHATRGLVGHENTHRWMVVAINTYKFTVFEILGDFVVLS